jgi:regulator of replication initiation timing
VTNPPKGKNDRPAEADPLEAVFDQLERKVEALAQRLKAALEENGKLKVAAIAVEAEREKLRADLAEARKSAGKGDEAAETLRRYESERAEVRARIERLIASLGGA